MQENNEQVVTEEVKPIELETVPVDEIVGQPTESNNNNNDYKGRSPRELVLIIIAALTMIASGLYFAFTSEDDSDSGNEKSEVVEIDDKNETLTVKPTVYYTNSFNSEKYDFNAVKNLTTTDTITEHDLAKEGKEITYTFTIENKRVVVSNSYGSKYTINKINNAKQLLVTSMGQSQRTGAFVITEDNKLYSIGLYGDNKTDQIITDCKNLENVVKEEMSNVKTISSGSLVEKNTTGGEGVVLIETNDNNKYVLAIREIK